MRPRRNRSSFTQNTWPHKTFEREKKWKKTHTIVAAFFFFVSSLKCTSIFFYFKRKKNNNNNTHFQCDHNDNCCRDDLLKRVRALSCFHIQKEWTKWLVGDEKITAIDKPKQREFNTCSTYCSTFHRMGCWYAPGEKKKYASKYTRSFAHSSNEKNDTQRE